MLTVQFSGNPRENIAGEAACLDLCATVNGEPSSCPSQPAHLRTPWDPDPAVLTLPGCIGVFYWPYGDNGESATGRCYLKNTNYGNAAFRSDTVAARTPNSMSSLQGTCNVQSARGSAYLLAALIIPLAQRHILWASQMQLDGSRSLGDETSMYRAEWRTMR